MMQDRFKFRAWDRINNKWLSNKNCIEIGTGYLTNFYDVEQAFNRRYVLMQCTGLKDRNGKLIYEGDIVFYKIGSIKTRDVVGWSYERCGWVKGSQDLSTYQKYCEVIGNAYENKELLESEG